MALCGGCGEQSSRIHITMTTGGGKTLLPEGERKEICPNCAPEYFQDPFLGLDNKIWHEHEAKPHLYRQLPDGSFTATDTLLADIDAAMNDDPDSDRKQQAIARKRATRRLTPLTQSEIDAAENAWRPVVAEMKQRHEQAIKADELATEALVLKHVRESYDHQHARNA